MPMMPAHRCASCGALVTGRCPVCRRRPDQRRPNAAARGYCSARWRAFRALQLERFPLCAVCEAQHRVTPATCVDHVRPVEDANDPRFLDYTAVQSLCAACHSRKTATEDSAFARRTP